MLFYCTYCSAEKNYSENPLPAIERYQSDRIIQIYDSAESQGLKFVILSGKYGLVEPHQKISYYDHLLKASEVKDHAELVAAQLKEKNISQIEFYMDSIEQDKNIKPYLDCILKASAKSGIAIKFREASFND